MPKDSDGALRDRVRKLEAQLDELTEDVSVDDLVSIGMSRRQALALMGGGSAAFLAGIRYGAGNVSADTHVGNVGTPSNRVNVYANDLDALSIVTGELGGSLVDRSESITHLPGNIYITEEGAADPTENDGDLWFEYEVTNG